MENIRDVQSSILTFKHFSLSLPSPAEGNSFRWTKKKLVTVSVLHIFIHFSANNIFFMLVVCQFKIMSVCLIQLQIFYFDH